MTKDENCEWGFLGPSGSFSEEALRKVMTNNDCKCIPFDSILTLLNAFRNGEVEKVILPIENSIEGIVIPAIDKIINGDIDFVIEREIELLIIQNLIGRGELQNAKIVVSHPQALAQCTKFIEMYQLITKQSDSTSAGVELVSKNKNKKDLMAIGSRLAAEIYNLEIIREGIQDSKENSTRFIVLGHNSQQITRADKTSLIFEIENKSGALLRVLEIFDALDINMTNIISRPSKAGSGKYIFWVDIEGHQLRETVSVALKQIRKRTNILKILGSYPKAK